jgi:hypothetical protein
MTVPVDIHVQITLDGVVFEDPQNVSLQVFDETSSAFIAAGTSDVLGKVSLLLPGAVGEGQGYEVRFFKRGVLFNNPYRILVRESGPGEVFDVRGTPTTFAPPADPRICRCMGRFVDFSNRGLRKRLVRVFSNPDVYEKRPKVLDGQMIAVDVSEYWTNEEGWVVIDLIRGAELFLMFAGESDEVWNFRVPDLPFANLIELVHPRPLTLSWDPLIAPGNTLLMKKGEVLEVPTNVTFSDAYARATGFEKWLHLSQTGAAVAGATLLDSGAVRIQAFTAGTARISMNPSPLLRPYRLPDYTLQASTLEVTVTPP